MHCRCLPWSCFSVYHFAHWDDIHSGKLTWNLRKMIFIDFPFQLYRWFLGSMWFFWGVCSSKACKICFARLFVQEHHVAMVKLLESKVAGRLTELGTSCSMLLWDSAVAFEHCTDSAKLSLGGMKPCLISQSWKIREVTVQYMVQRSRRQVFLCVSSARCSWSYCWWCYSSWDVGA